MSKVVKTVNSITNTIINISIKIIIYALLAVILVKGAKISYEFGHEIFYASSVDPVPGRDVSVTITKGMSSMEVAKLLYDKGLLVSQASFVVQSKFFKYSIRPGDYILNTSSTSRDILEKLDAISEETGE